MYFPRFWPPISNVYIYYCSWSHSNNYNDSSRICLATVFVAVFIVVVFDSASAGRNIIRINLFRIISSRWICSISLTQQMSFISKNLLCLLGIIPLSHLQNSTKNGERTTRGCEQSSNCCKQTHISVCMRTRIWYNQRIICTGKHFSRCGKCRSFDSRFTKFDQLN